jgi:hypothetical protein
MSVKVSFGSLHRGGHIAAELNYTHILSYTLSTTACRRPTCTSAHHGQNFLLAIAAPCANALSLPQITSGSTPLEPT